MSTYLGECIKVYNSIETERWILQRGCKNNLFIHSEKITWPKKDEAYEEDVEVSLQREEVSILCRTTQNSLQY